MILLWLLLGKYDKMIRTYIKIFLFLSSYSPLFIILAIKSYQYFYLVLSFVGLVVISNIVLFFVLFKSKKMSGDYYKINKIEDKSSQFLEYIIAYIIPFLGFNLLQITDVLILGILFFMIASIYINSDLIYMNPVMNLFKYKLYKVTTDSKEYMIISKEDIEKIKKSSFFLME